MSLRNEEKQFDCKLDTLVDSLMNQYFNSTGLIINKDIKKAFNGKYPFNIYLMMLKVPYNCETYSNIASKYKQFTTKLNHRLELVPRSKYVYKFYNFGCMVFLRVDKRRCLRCLIPDCCR